MKHSSHVSVFQNFAPPMDPVYFVATQYQMTSDILRSKMDFGIDGTDFLPCAKGRNSFSTMMLDGPL